MVPDEVVQQTGQVVGSLVWPSRKHCEEEGMVPEDPEEEGLRDEGRSPEMGVTGLPENGRGCVPFLLPGERVLHWGHSPSSKS